MNKICIFGGRVATAALLAFSGLAPAAHGQPVNPAPVIPAAPVAAPSFADIIARVAPTVVSIDVEGAREPQRAQADPFGEGSGGDDDPLSQFRRMFPQLQQTPPQPMRGTASGFFISPDGYIVTNNHVVEGADKITVRLAAGDSLPATLVGRDPATDLAVIKVTGRSFPFVNLDEHASPRVGDWVVALGNPFNLGGTATAGIVSALNRANVSGSGYIDYLQIDAPINRGNSGGPTFDINGHLVGVNTAIFSPSGGSVGIGFDIPADVAADVTRELIAHGRVTRGFIGASVQDLTPDIAQSLGLAPHSGALVAEVTSGGPAAEGGLQPGDVVTRVDGQPVGSAAELTRRVGSIAPGSAAQLVVRRGDRTMNLSLRTRARPAEAQLAAGANSGPAAAPRQTGELGLAVEPAAGGGLTVRQVAPDSDAARKGVRPGDVIRRVGTRPANTAADVAAEIARAKAAGRSQVLLLIARGSQQIFVPVAFASPAR